MRDLGRFQLGATVSLDLQCKDASNTPAVPDHPPQVKIFQGSTLIDNQTMPVLERYITNGRFRFPLFLGSLYAAGYYQAVFYYRVGGVYGLETDNFTVVGGGDTRGSVIGAYFYERPEASYVVQSLENGSIIKGRNPTV